MATIPPDLQAKIDDAETKLENAKALDAAHDATSTALATAQGNESAATAAALSAHQDANASATDMIAALKTYFGLPT